MADKNTGGKNKIGFENDAIDYAILGFIVLLVLGSILGIDDINDAPQYLENISSNFFNSFSASFYNWFIIHSSLLNIVSVSLILFSVAGITYFLLKVRRIRIEERKKNKPIKLGTERSTDRQVQWAIILKHISSENSAEWKIGIIEADNMLDELLKEKGYLGENLGERLKFAETHGLKTLNDAWEAHKARNKLVHEEVTQQLNKRDVRKIIDAYERVLRELGYL